MSPHPAPASTTVRYTAFLGYCRIASEAADARRLAEGAWTA
jgi:hypothetical protein